MTTIALPSQCVNYAAMTMDQIIASRTPVPSPHLTEARAILAADNRARLMAASSESIGRAPIDPPTDWGAFDPAAPDNNTDPQHPVDNRAAVAFCLPGGRATSLHEAAFMENAIPASFYPVGTTVVYPGMNRRLTQAEADYLNGATP